MYIIHPSSSALAGMLSHFIMTLFELMELVFSFLYHSLNLRLHLRINFCARIISCWVFVVVEPRIGVRIPQWIPRLPGVGVLGMVGFSFWRNWQ